MLLIAVVAVIATAGFILVLAAVVLVTIGVRQEERRLTFIWQRAPTRAARFARRIVGSYVRPAESEMPAVRRAALRRPAGESGPDESAPDEPDAASPAPGAAA